MNQTLPPVSVIMPVLNEETHLPAAIAGIVSQDYPAPLEIILAIGPSNDRTTEIATRLAAADERIRIVENPAKTTPVGLNLAIAAASHDIIIRVDAHGELCPGYVRTVVETLDRTGAANVGGLMKAVGVTPFERAVAAAYNSPVGLGGGSFHLENTPEGPADTVFLGSFRAEALKRVGGFDESLDRAQDWELNYRLRKSGQVVWYTPQLRVTYRPRSSFRSLAKQFFKTGQWRREVVQRHPDTASARYLAPPAFVLALSMSPLAFVPGPKWLRSLFLVAPVAYLAFNVASSIALTRDDPEARLRLPLVLATMHICWGAGFLVGLPKRD